MADLNLAFRTALPDALRVLLADYPKTGWTGHPNFDGLVQFWLDRHLMFRRLMTELTKNTEAALDQAIEAQRYLALLSRHGGMFVNGLHEHHMIEDSYYFPKLALRDDRITAGFEILDQDHKALDVHLNNFVTSANDLMALGDKPDRLKDAAGRLHIGLENLDALLDRHLTDEEELIVPVILKYGSGGLG